MARSRSDVGMTTRSALLIGMTGALVGTALASSVTRRAKPLAVRAMKEVIVLRENVKARIAEIREDIEDLVAAAEFEYRTERHGAEPGEAGDPPRAGG